MSKSPTTTLSAPVRRASGVLRANVAAHLAAAPSDEFTVTQVAKALGASGGAVGNALMALAVAGCARMTNDAPRRFSATGHTAAVAKRASATPRPKPVPTPRPRPAEPPLVPRPRPASPKTAASPSYQHRELAGMPDVEALRALREAGVYALLYGPPGTGKTSVIQAAFPDVITVCGDGDLQVSDLVGEWTQNPDGTYAFRYGPLVTAMQEGRVLFIDDATLIPPAVLAAVYSATDSRRSITVKAHKGETITAAPGFWFCAGRNPGVAGEHLSEALASRLSVHIAVSSDLDIAQEAGVNAQAVTVARNLAARVASGEHQWSPQLRELLAFARVEKALGAQAAFANLVGIAPEAERDAVASVVASVIGTEAAPLALGARITP